MSLRAGFLIPFLIIDVIEELRYKFQVGRFGFLTEPTLRQLR